MPKGLYIGDGLYFNHNEHVITLYSPATMMEVAMGDTALINLIHAIETSRNVKITVQYPVAAAEFPRDVAAD